MSEEVSIETNIQNRRVEEKSEYQTLKDQTLQKLSILGNKIETCLDLTVENAHKEEEINLLLQTVRLIYQELLLLKDDVETLKSYSSSS